MKAIVLGGGLVGLNTALSLQQRGFDVTLIEREAVRTAASYGNAGHIAIEQVEPLASMAMVRSAPRRLYPAGALALPLDALRHWLPFSFRLLKAARPDRFAKGKAALSQLIGEAMPAWERRVADIGASDLLRQDGHYVVWETAESARKGLASWTATDTGSARFRPVTLKEMAQLSAMTTTSIAGAIRFENTGQISDTRRLLDTLEKTFTDRGGTMVFDAGARIVGGRQTASVRTGQGLLDADIIVVCAGVWSKALLKPFGVHVPIIAERGYHIQSADHGWPEGLPPVVFEDRSMIVTGFEGGLRAASFVELNHVDAPADPGKWARLKQHVAALGLPFGKPDDAARWMGARPTLPDYLPAIGRLAPGSNLYYAFGHQHLGLTLAPLTGEIVADMVTGGPAPEAFSLNRFQ